MEEKRNFWERVYMVAFEHVPQVEHNESGIPVPVTFDRKAGVAAELADAATVEWLKRWGK